MNNYSCSVINTIENLIYEYMCNTNGIKPKTIFISKNFIDLLKTDYILSVAEVDGETELTICGLKIYEVIQDGVIKVTD